MIVINTRLTNSDWSRGERILDENTRERCPWYVLGLEIAKIMAKSEQTIDVGYATVDKVDLAVESGRYGVLNIECHAGRARLFVELKTNKGPSITNAAERVIAETDIRFGKASLYAEHYEGDPRERIDKIIIDKKGNVKWAPMLGIMKGTMK